MKDCMNMKVVSIEVHDCAMGVMIFRDLETSRKIASGPATMKKISDKL